MEYNFSYLMNWEEISKRELSIHFIEKFHNYINWRSYEVNAPVTDNVIKKYKQFINLRNVQNFDNLSYDVIREYAKEFNWKYISNSNPRKILNIKFIKEFGNKLDWEIIKRNCIRWDIIPSNKRYVNSKNLKAFLIKYILKHNTEKML